MVLVRIAGTGKRDALAFGFRAISKLSPPEDAVVAVIDGAGFAGRMCGNIGVEQHLVEHIPELFDQVFDADVAVLSIDDLGATLVAVVLLHRLEFVDDDLHQEAFACENRAQPLDYFQEFGDLVEDRTLVHLWLRPVRRASVTIDADPTPSAIAEALNQPTTEGHLAVGADRSGGI